MKFFSTVFKIFFYIFSFFIRAIVHCKFHIKGLLKFLAFLILLSIVIDFVFLVYNFYFNWREVIGYNQFILNGEGNNLPMDPVRWYPSGVPQGIGVVGGGLASYVTLSQLGNVSPRMRVLASLGAMGVSSAHIVYNSALENSVGFNRLAWGFTKWTKTGTWPSLDEVAKSKSPQELEKFASDAMNQADQQVVYKVVAEVKNSTNNFLPSLDSYKDVIDTIIDKIFTETIQIIQPVPVQGFLDDLIGQRMFIEVILFISCFFTILLIIAFCINLIFLLNKDKFIKFFDNKFFTLYFKYQALIAKISLFYLPLFIALGLYTITHGLYWLITHQIPYNSLDIELHQFISTKESILGIILSSKPNSKVSTLSKTKKRFTNKIQELLQKSTVHCSLLKSSQRKMSCGTQGQASNLNKSNLVLTSISYDFDSPIFRKILSLLNEGVNKENQLQIEQLLQNQALDIAKNKLKSHGLIQNSNHSLLILKLKEISPRLEKIINNYKTNLILMDSNLSSLSSKILYNVNTTYLISIMYGRLLNIVSNNQLLNNKTYQVEVTIDLGREIVNNYIREMYKTIKQSNPSLTYINWRASVDIFNQTSESQFQFELGNLLINFMIELKLIKNEVKILARNEKKTILVAGPALVNLVPELKTSFSIQTIPNKIPMVSPPNSYKYEENKILELGGYLLNGVEYADEILLSNRELSYKSSLLRENEIVDMVNKINSVAFRINDNVLDFILNNNHKYGFFQDFKSVNPLSSKDKLTITEQKELLSLNSKKHLELNILGLATIFRNVPSIYLPVRIDYRGRLYCITEYLNYQGIELSKGLLEFSIGEKVKLTNQEAINYLKIFGANCFGNGLGKKSFLHRIAWVDNNKLDIVNFENGILLSQAENKTIFLSFCFEYKKFVEALNNNSSDFITNLPIQLDASCNGFQHLTLLVDDLALAKELNLNESTWEDIPKDFYRFIGLKVQNYFFNKLEEYRQGKLNLSLEEFESFKKLAELNIFRNLVKRAVMTIPYNASASSIIDYLKDNFDKKKNPEFKPDSELESVDVSKEHGYKDYYIYVMKSDVSKNETVVTFKEIDFKNLRKALNFSIFVEYPKLTALAEYLKGVANVANKLEIQIPWYLPSGLIVNQQYYKTETIKIKPFAYTKNIVNLSVLNKTKFNKNKQKIALMPNLIHSLDAASLCLVIVNYFKLIDNLNFYSIHDCFAVPCNKVNNLYGLLKSAYCIIYSDNKYLLDFDTNFRSLINKIYGTQAVSFKDDEGKVTINFNDEIISIKFPSIRSVLLNTKSEIKLTNSNYLIH